MAGGHKQQTAMRRTLPAEETGSEAGSHGKRDLQHDPGVCVLEAGDVHITFAWHRQLRRVLRLVA